VVPQPVPRLARKATLHGMPGRLKLPIPWAFHRQSTEAFGTGLDSRRWLTRIRAWRFRKMTNKPDSKDTAKAPSEKHPGMMGDGTEEQNLGQPGNPAARIKKGDVDAAFANENDKKA
jgi:hypothetical protein